MKNIIILGAAGKDFHVFNCLYRQDPQVSVKCFTAAQIPGISGRMYPKELAGDLYPSGIPIFDEKDLESLINNFQVDTCVFAYSDLSHEQVMHLASRTTAAGADFLILTPEKTMLHSNVPTIAVLATRTGCGKSQTTRFIVKELKKLLPNAKMVSVRHPMPYDEDLNTQACQRYSTLEDLKKYKCTIEEMEEYEPHVVAGNVIYAGVDYQEILKKAQREADILLWDGGNNDTSFYKPDLLIVVADALRPNHELKYHPGETNVRMANVVVINKCDSASKEDVEQVVKNVEMLNPNAKIIKAKSPTSGRVAPRSKVLLIEDGPTVTHGGMKTGAATVAMKLSNAIPVDPTKYAVGSIVETFGKYPHCKGLLPAMGYGLQQVKDLKDTIVQCCMHEHVDFILSGTPIDLARVLEWNDGIEVNGKFIPMQRVTYELEDDGELQKVVQEFVGKIANGSVA